MIILKLVYWSTFANIFIPIDQHLSGCFFYETRCSAPVCAIFFPKNIILQGSVATPFRCGGNFNEFCGNFFPESTGRRISKIGHNLAKI